MSDSNSSLRPDRSSEPANLSASSAKATFGILLSPALAFFLSASLWRGDSEARILILISGSILASVMAGIWSGYRFGLLLAPGNRLKIPVMVGLCILCIGASAIVCFGGCLYGDRLSR